MSVLEELKIPITDRSQVPATHAPLTHPIHLEMEDFIVRSLWWHLRSTPDTLVVLVDDHQVEFWRPLITR